MAKIGSFTFNPDCRYYIGYKPCRFKRLCKGCEEYAPMNKRLLLINLDAMGDVLMTTAMLPPLRRKYGEDCHITWVTRSNAIPLLRDNPMVDKIVPYDPEGCMILSQQKFDAAFNCDKSENACALLNIVPAKHKYGFGLSEFGTIVPANPENAYNFELGMHDELKFHTNTQPGTQILHEAMGLEFKRAPYTLVQSEEELALTEAYKQEHNLSGKTVIGINTGCSALFELKKLSEEQIIELVGLLQDTFPDALVALVGGRDETERNSRITAACKDVLNTPTTLGLRRGIGFIDACDILITGDTMALHIGVALNKYVVAFFNITCPAEIDLYDNGAKVISDADCAPCWRRECDDMQCMQNMKMEAIVDGVRGFFREKESVES